MTALSAPAIAIIIVAAGSGTRLGASEPKAFVELAGRTLLRHALEGVRAAGPMQVIVVAPPGFERLAETELRATASSDRMYQ